MSQSAQSAGTETTEVRALPIRAHLWLAVPLRS
jgi:hypothetical protein